MNGVIVVRSLLVADTEVTALVPAVRIVAGMLAQGTSLPAISLMSVSSTDRNIAAPGPKRMVTERVQVTVLAAILLLMRVDHHPPASKFVGDRIGSRLFVSLLTATVITGLLLAVTAQPFDAILGAYYGQHSLPDAHGYNVVNVILVDFRGFDTFGENSVIFLSLLAILPLLAAIRKRVSHRTIHRLPHEAVEAAQEGKAP